MGHLGQNLRYAVRMLLKQPYFTALGILAMAVGIGANSAVFSVAYSLLLKPLPYPQSERIVVVREQRPQQQGGSVSYPNYLDWCQAQQSLADLSIVRQEEVNLEADRNAEPERLLVIRGSFNFLGILRLKPVLGRDFTDQDDTAGARPVALIADALWRKRFGGTSDVIGRQLGVDGVVHEIVGVMPPQMESGHQAQVFLPLGKLRADPAILNRGNRAGFVVVARLKEGVPIEKAQAEFDIIGKAAATQYSANRDIRIVVRSLRDVTVGSHLSELYVLIGAAACILLIACANVAGLLVARGTARQQELAIRSALGATRRNLMLQLLVEGELLCLAGGAAGLVLAAWTLRLMTALGSSDTMSFGDARVNAAALLFTGLVSVGTGLVAGTWPAWRAADTASPAMALRDASARTSAGQGRQRLRAGLVIAQLGLALMLLSSAGLLLRSFWNAQHVKLGFDPRNLVLVSVSLPPARYPDGASQAQFYRLVLDRLQALPGVESAASGQNIPFDGSAWDSTFRISGQPPSQPGREPRAEVSVVSPDYFKTMKIALLRGRLFGPQDVAGDAWSVIVDESFARRFFGERDPVGQNIDNHQIPAKNPPPMTVVGVVGRTVNDDPSGDAEAKGLPQMYLSSEQSPRRAANLIVRAPSNNSSTVAQAIKREVLAVDPNQAVSDIRTMEKAVDNALSSRRQTMTLIVILAGMALALATIGLFGVMALRVTQRTREIGIRLALGAQRTDILRVMMTSALKLVAAGVVIGGIASLALGRALSGMLYGVTAADPLTFCGTALILSLIALLAAYFPAAKAMRVDPIVALHEE